MKALLKATESKSKFNEAQVELITFLADVLVGK